MATTYGSRTDPGLLVTPVAAGGTAVTHGGFRPDIEGLRAVAVTLVVLGHAGVTLVSGGYVGVDVFFVISGFLITTLLVKELTRTGTISLAGFYARRATRLLPASTLVLVLTVVAAWLWLPPTRFASIAADALYTTFYGINWRLAGEGIDYLNAAAAPSPLQHMWSLAVEEQFYLVWPLLLLAVAWFWRRHNSTNRLPIVVALAVIVVVSLVISVRQTASAAPWAYFGAHTRAWELGIGALVAMGTAALGRTPKMVAGVLAAGGLVAVVAAALLFDEQTAFPGYAAALPVLGTAAIIAGGCARPRGGVGALLGTWPFQQIGRLSYGWYLWHWPVLMIGPSALGLEPSVTLNLLLAAGALLLAIASYHLVENPVRSRPWVKARSSRGLAVGLALSASAAAFALVAGMFTPATGTGLDALDTAEAVRAAADPQAELAALVAKATTERRLPENLTPAITDAEKDLPVTYAAGCHLGYEGTEQTHDCVYGDPNGKQTMYLVGDSHGAHWFPTLDEIARKWGWRLVAKTKSACQAPSVLVWQGVLKHKYDECVTFRNGLLAEIRAEKPAMVVMSSNGGDSGGLIDAEGGRVPTRGEQDDPLWVTAWQTTFSKIKQAGTKLVMIEDTPWPQGSAPECASTHPRELTACNRALDKAIAEPRRRRMVGDMARAQGVTVVDATPWFCTDTCPVVVGNILVYKDNSHQTTAYARMLAPILEAKLR